jgi:hypothetical protein
MACGTTATMAGLTTGLRYAVCYTDSRRRNRRRIFRQFTRAARFARKLRMGSDPTIKTVVSK